MLQMQGSLLTQGAVGRPAEFPKDGGNQRQIQESAKMKNISWKRKKEEETFGVFLSNRSLRFHPWTVNKDILEKQEQYLLKEDEEEDLGTVKRKESCYLLEAEEMFPHRPH